MERSGESPMFHYILPDGTEELFKVTPKMLEPQDIGIYVTNSMYDERYQEMMLQMSQALSQNAGEGMEAVSALIKAITSGASPEETHKLIQLEGEKQFKRMQELEQQKLKVQEEYAARQEQIREDDQAHELEKIDRKGKWDLEKAAIDLYKFTEDKNQDQDGIPDYLEALEAVRKMNETTTKLNLEKEKLNLKEKELDQKKELEEKKIKMTKKKSDKN